MHLTTPKGFRLHIAIFGRTNVGKSSLLNCLTQQETAIVSEQPGTTTDPVEKPMELLPIGPVLFIDTAGLDDLGPLGKLRVDKTLKVFDRADVILLVVEPNQWTEYERFIVQEAQKRNTPLLLVVNKIDIQPTTDSVKKKIIESRLPFVEVCSTKAGWQTTETVKNKLIEILPESFFTPPPIISDLIEEGDWVVLVIPVDKEAPKGRIILPQQAVLREILDRRAHAVVTSEKKLPRILASLTIKAKLVVTDSQVLEEVLHATPPDIPLTSFSILFARCKGDLDYFVQSVSTVDTLEEGNRVLIAEACTHHPIGDDIGRKKIPRWLQERTGKHIIFDWCTGKDFPDHLVDYQLIIHCGACMFNRKEMLARIYKAKSLGIPMTNYGVLIAFLKRGLSRALEVFSFQK